MGAKFGDDAPDSCITKRPSFHQLQSSISWVFLDNGASQNNATGIKNENEKLKSFSEKAGFQNLLDRFLPSVFLEIPYVCSLGYLCVFRG